MIMRAYLTSLFAAIVFCSATFAGETTHALEHVGAPKATSLNAKSAAKLAASLANAAARRRFGSAPFSASRTTAQLVRGQWHWQATAAYGKTDLLASVSFSQSGSDPTALVSQLVLPQW